MTFVVVFHEGSSQGRIPEAAFRCCYVRAKARLLRIDPSLGTFAAEALSMILIQAGVPGAVETAVVEEFEITRAIIIDVPPEACAPENNVQGEFCSRHR